jgi:predicted nucleic acid-binding protein
MANHDALLDASVIIPAPLNDTLLLAAEDRLYRVVRSDDTLEEVERNLAAAGLTTPAQAARRIAAMRRAFPRSAATGCRSLIERMTNHPKDRHVVAAAVATGVTVIVTINLRDFREKALAPHGIVAQLPDEFLLARDDRAADRMTAIVARQASILRQPSMTPLDVLDHLSPCAPRFAKRLMPRF